MDSIEDVLSKINDINEFTNKILYSMNKEIDNANRVQMKQSIDKNLIR